MSIAIRRHHRQRLMNKRRFHWGRDLSQNPKHLAMVVDTPKPCSCFMCSNSRRYEGATLQERRAGNMDLEIEEWRRSRTPPGFMSIEDYIARIEQDPVRREALVDARQWLAEVLYGVRD